jgi:hypothetical protein
VNGVARVCNIIDFTGYTNTITMSNAITVSGDVTLDSGMGIAGSGGLGINATGTITPNGKTWPNDFSTAAAITVTLAADFTVTGTTTVGTSTTTFNSNTLFIGGGLTMTGASTGTTAFTLNGTGTWSGNNEVGNNFTINTSGTITVSGSVRFGNSKTLTNTAGTVVTTGSTCTIASSATLNSNGITWAALSISGSITVTLTSNCTCTGLLTLNTCTINLTTTEKLSTAGGLSIIGGSVGGTVKVEITGGTWTCGGGVSLDLPLEFNGNATISGIVNHGGTSFTHVSGTVTTTGSTVQFSRASLTTTITSGTIVYNAVVMSGGIGNTITLADNMTVAGNFICGNNNGSTVNGFSITISGDLTVQNGAATGGILGTTNLIMAGRGTWSSSGGSIKNNLTINTDSGVITISGTVRFDTGIFTYTKGPVIATSGTLDIRGNCTLTNIHKIAFGGGVIIGATSTVTMNRFFRGLGNLPCAVRPSTTEVLTLLITQAHIANFVTVKNVQMSSSSVHKLHIGTSGANRGGNAGIIFDALQIPQGGIGDDDWAQETFGILGYYNNFGQNPQGLIK